MRIGVLVNPSAGHGQRAQAVISRLEVRWQGHQLLAVDGPAAPCFSRAELLPEPAGGYVEKLFGSVRALLTAGAEMIVTLGGDGTAAYVAEALGDARRTVPLLGIVVVSTVLPYVLYTWGLQRMDSGRAAILAAVEPLVGTVLGMAAYGESRAPAKLAGILLILAAILLLNRREKST